MDTTQPSAEDELSAIIASAANQPLLDAAYGLWRQRHRLETIAGRPTAEEVRINRTLTPERSAPSTATNATMPMRGRCSAI